MFTVRRNEHNPILKPRPQVSWECFGTFNPSVINDGKKVHMVYRALGTPELIEPKMPDYSTVGYAVSTDGVHFNEHRQLFKPEMEWEKFGCEDPRITFFEGKYYIFYTALSKYPFSAAGIKIAVAVTTDFITFEKHLVTPFNGKAMVLFPKRVNGKVVVMFSIHTDMPPARMAIAELDDIEHLWSTKFWEKWYTNWQSHTVDIRRLPEDHIEVGAVPIETNKGWVVLYSHVENYFSDQKVFGIEAILFDKNNLNIVLGRTKGPMLVPEESYEKNGVVQNVTFPTGGYVDKEYLHIYYGAADTVGARASVYLEHFFMTIIPATGHKLVERSIHNPILAPLIHNPWESKAVFNPTAIEINKKIYILYRAMGEDNTSTVGLAISLDGVTIEERLPIPIYKPRAPFEEKRIPNGNSGCEDARIVRIKDTLYMTYTAYNGVESPRVAISTISVANFEKRNWDAWSMPVIITPDGVDDKDSTILPEEYNKHFLIIHRIGVNMCADFLPSLDFAKNRVNKCIEIMRPRPGMWDGKKLGLSGPPIKTARGWLWLYHGISPRGTYRLGAALFDLKDPIKLISRLSDPILSPETTYELHGQVDNVVFPCGALVRGDTLFIYYGGADSVTGVAMTSLKLLLDALEK